MTAPADLCPCGHADTEHDGMGDCHHGDARTVTGFCQRCASGGASVTRRLIDTTDPELRDALTDALVNMPARGLLHGSVVTVVADDVADAILAALDAAGQPVDGGPHMIELRDDGWTLQHPLSERLDGSLFDCPLNAAGRATWDEPPAEAEVPGRYEATLSDGRIVLGARVDGGAS